MENESRQTRLVSEPGMGRMDGRIATGSRAWRIGSSVGALSGNGSHIFLVMQVGREERSHAPWREVTRDRTPICRKRMLFYTRGGPRDIRTIRVSSKPFQFIYIFLYKCQHGADRCIFVLESLVETTRVSPNNNPDLWCEVCLRTFR